MGTPGPVQFEIKEQVPVTLVVTTSDGQKYDLLAAIVIHGVSDQGVINPIDGTPLLQLASQLVMQVRRHADD
jgi:hypothetical protein